MASKLDNLVRLTAQTFLHRREALNAVTSAAATESHNLFQNKFSELVSMVANIKGEDIRLSKLLQYVPQLSRHQVSALYTGIYEGPLFCVCIFILYPKAKIPLHSHPGMFGILKVIQGQIQVKSYCSLSKVDYMKPVGSFNALETTQHVNQDSPPTIITPDSYNLHEIINHENQSAVFLDILSPRYENENCYFNAREMKPGVFEVNQIPCPSTFHTITIPFPLKVKVPQSIEQSS